MEKKFLFPTVTGCGQASYTELLSTPPTILSVVSQLSRVSWRGRRPGPARDSLETLPSLPPAHQGQGHRGCE